MFMTLLASFAWSTLLLAFFTVAGLGTLRLLGVRDLKGRVLLAPAAFVAVLALTLVIVVLMQIPLRYSTPYLWVMAAGLAACGCFGMRGVFEDRNHLVTAAFAILVTLLVLAGFQWYGLFAHLGSPNQDGFTYVAFGEYLRQYPRGTEGGLAPLYQYGAHLSATRYVAGAVLGTFVPPGSSHVDTQMMVGPLLLLGTFTFAMAVGYASHVIAERGLQLAPSLVVLLAVLGGWFPYVLHANNFDNLIVLSLAPALYGIAIDKRISGSARWLLPALLSAAAIYIYPELCVLVIACYYLACVDRLLTANRREQILLWCAVAVATLVLIGPYLPDAIRFFQNQFAMSKPMTGHRPGNGFMPDLLVFARLPAAIWGFQQGTAWGAWTNSGGLVLGVGLMFIALVGLAGAMRARLYSLSMLVIITAALCAVMIAVKRYDYGAYKILLFGWWYVAVLLSVGVGLVWRLRPTVPAGVLVASRLAVAVFMLLALWLWVAQQLQWLQETRHKVAKPLVEAREQVAKLGETVTVSVADPILNAWMVFELRAFPIVFQKYNGYLEQAHVLPVLARSSVPKDGGRYLMVGADEATTGEPVWSNEKYQIFRLTDGQSLVTFGQIRAPNSVEQVDGKVFFWLGREAATIELNASKVGNVSLKLSAIGGTSVGDSTVPLAITVNAGGVQVAELDLYRGPDFTLQVPVREGPNTLELQAKYAGKEVANPNGDQRVLLAGVKLLDLQSGK